MALLVLSSASLYILENKSFKAASPSGFSDSNSFSMSFSILLQSFLLAYGFLVVVALDAEDCWSFPVLTVATGTGSGSSPSKTVQRIPSFLSILISNLVESTLNVHLSG